MMANGLGKSKEDYEEERKTEEEKGKETLRIVEVMKDIELDTRRTFDPKRKELDLGRLRATHMKTKPK